ncbi:Piwi domain containing protein [Tylopilus felleus]
MSHRGGGPPQGNRRLQVITNSFKITGLPRKSYYQYDAFDDSKISEKSQSHRRIEVFERLQNHTQPNIFTPKVIYDSDAIAYSSTVLSFGNATTFEVNMSDRAPREGAVQARGLFRVALKRVDAAPITFEDLQHLIDGRTKQQTPRATVALNLVQLIVRQAPNLKYPNNVRAFFCREAGSRELGGGLEVFRGFYQSVRPALRSLLVNIDTTCGVIYQDGPMVEVAMRFMGAQLHPRVLNLSEGPELARLKKFFKGVLITFTHRKGKKKIESIVPRAGAQKFEWNRDDVTQSTTVEAYFRQAYNITLRFPDAVGVKIGGGSVVPIELCMVAPNQRFKRKVPPELTKKMVDFTSDKPKERLESISRGIVGAGAALDYAASPFVKDAELQVSTTPIVIDGKVLSTPPMQYKNVNNPQIPKFGAWNAVNQQFSQAKQINCWGVVDYSSQRDRQANQKFVGMIRHNCQKLEMATPQAYITGSGNHVSQDLMRAAQEAAGNNAIPDLILVILPPSALEIRYQVKRHGDVLHGVVTQCVRVDKVARANDQYCNNVAMKINAKLGGVNAVPMSGMLMKLASKPYIIMAGADVGHPAPGVYDQPSVASLVASYDHQAMKYHAYTGIQPPRTETIDQLRDMVYQALHDFGAENRAAPQRFIFFRDGLSEGEYEGVAEKEVKDIKAAIDQLWQDRKLDPQKSPKPPLTFVVVGKRHHVRFFPQTERDADRSGNCPAGFVADQGIGNPIAMDYYLQSHGGLLGTSRPSHYIIIRDENFNNNIEALQELSFALCHSYARATRSVSIPAPVYYADLVCSRAGFHFAPELKYDDSSASVTSGKTTFNLDRWRSGFQGVHRNMLKKMFYM